MATYAFYPASEALRRAYGLNFAVAVGASASAARGAAESLLGEPGALTGWASVDLTSAPAPFVSGLPVGAGGRVDVAADLSAPGFEGVYVLGDAANIPDGKGGALPQLGSVAQQSGRCAAENIHADLTGGTRKPFKYLDKGIMAMIGRGAAVAELGRSRRQIEGDPAFIAWLGVHVMLLSGTWQKAGALVNWMRDYGTDRGARRKSYR